MIGFLTGSESLLQKNAYNSCALCISIEQSVLKTINHRRPGRAPNPRLKLLAKNPIRNNMQSISRSNDERT
jgi:hypothetical protein